MGLPDQILGEVMWVRNEISSSKHAYMQLEIKPI